jgi:hypothetical protein
MKKVGGRKKGTPNKATLAGGKRPISDADVISDVTRKAKLGKIDYQRLYLRYLLPPPERFIGPVVGYRRPTNVEEAREAILDLHARLALREISVEAHDALLHSLRIYLAMSPEIMSTIAQRFVVVEGNLNSELPLPVGDAALVTEPDTPVSDAPTPETPEPAPQLDESGGNDQRVLPFPVLRDGLDRAA